MKNEIIHELVDKPFLTMDEQIELLKNRGLRIQNVEIAKSFLLENNYYRISGYTLSMRNNDVFFPDASFNNIVDIYNFDISFRNVVLYFLEIVEVKIKSLYIHEFSKKYGPFGYMDYRNFSNNNLYFKVLRKVKASKKNRVRYEKYLKHYKYDLKSNKLPFWVIIELFSLSDISILFSISDKNIKSIVSEGLGLKFENSYNTLKNYMDWLVMLRNICAHGGRIYNRGFPGKPRIRNVEGDTILLLDNNENETPFFAYMFIFKKLLSEGLFSQFKREIEELEVKSVKYGKYCDFKYYGFPKNWKDIL